MLGEVLSLPSELKVGQSHDDASGNGEKIKKKRIPILLKFSFHLNSLDFLTLTCTFWTNKFWHNNNLIFLDYFLSA